MTQMQGISIYSITQDIMTFLPAIYEKLAYTHSVQMMQQLHIPRFVLKIVLEKINAYSFATSEHWLLSFTTSFEWAFFFDIRILE